MICNRRANAINGVVWIGCGDVRLGNRIHTFPTPLGVSLNAAPISTYSLFPLIVVYLVYVVMCKNCSFSRKHPLPLVPLSPCPRSLRRAPSLLCLLLGRAQEVLQTGLEPVIRLFQQSHLLLVILLIQRPPLRLTLLDRLALCLQLLHLPRQLALIPL